MTDICQDCGIDLSYTYEHEDGTVKTYSRRTGIEYSYRHPDHYDGVSEWMCPECGARRGRWTNNLLKEGEFEPRYGGRSF